MAVVAAYSLVAGATATLLPERAFANGGRQSSQSLVLRKHQSGAILQAQFSCQGLNIKRSSKCGTRALFGGGGSEPGAKSDKKKFISREEEPEEYWVSASEKEGKSPFQTLLPYVAILGLLTPFIILGIAYSMGAIKLPNY